MAATAKRNDLRLIAIVLGENESKVRNNETMKLLDYGFDNFKIDILKRKNDVIDYLNIDNANKTNVPIILKDDLSILNKKSSKSVNYDYEVKLKDLKLPIKSGSIVGVVNLLDNGMIIKSSDLIVLEDISKINYFKYILNDFFLIF